MNPFRSTAIAVIALAASAGLAVAQTQDDEAAHHAAQAGASATQAGTPAHDQDEDHDHCHDRMGSGMMGPGMMGGGGMAPMMRMMQGMTEMMQGVMQMMQATGQATAQPGMMPGAMMESRVAALKAELGITDAQQPQWNAFADALRARAKAMQGMRAQMMPQGATASWPDRLTQHERKLSAHLDAMKAMEGPVKALWDSLSDEQRRKAEELMPGPMGMMGMMGRM